MHITVVKEFDYSFIADLAVPTRTFRLMHSILSENDKLQQMAAVNPDVFSKLRDIASIESVRSSNAIEGIVTSDERLRGIVLHDTEPVGHDEEEIAGYRDAIGLLHREHKELDFDTATVQSLHRTMYSHILTEGGVFKKKDNAIVEHGPGGTVIRWMPTSAEETPAAIEEMIAAYAKAAKNPDIEPLVLIPCVILDFLCVHPFPDGNGRVSRLLTDLLMYKHGIEIQRYISLEEAIDTTKDRYYDSLRESSAGWHENHNDYVPFITYFLETTNICIRELDKRRLTTIIKKGSKTERIERTLLESMVPISKKEVYEQLLDVSPSTVEAVISRMLRDGQIVKIGTTRSARYRKARQFDKDVSNVPDVE